MNGLNAWATSRTLLVEVDVKNPTGELLLKLSYRVEAVTFLRAIACRRRAIVDKQNSYLRKRQE